MRLTIAGRLVIPFIVVCSAIILLLGLASVNAISGISKQSLDEKSHSLLLATVSELRGPFLLGEDRHVQRILTVAVKSDPDLIYAIVTNTDGTPESAVYDKQGVHTAGSITTTSLPKDTDYIRIDARYGNSFELIAPIELGGERGGFLRMGFTMQRIGEQIRMAEISMGTMALLGLVAGSLLYVVSISRSIASEERANKLAAIVECSHDAIISVDMSGKIISWNAGAQSLIGYSAEEISGKSIDLLFPDQCARDRFHALIEGNAEAMPADNFETVSVRSDGTAVEVSMTLSKVVTEHDTSPSFSIIARDITHKNLVERRLKEFYSVVSHELRTPLTSIRGAVGLIADGVVPADSEDANTLLQLAKSSCVRLASLINDILDMRKIEEGNIDLHLQRVACDELVRRTVDEIKLLASEKGVELVNKCSTQAEVTADIDRMVQVLTNLISNAIKYSEPTQVVEVNVAPAAAGAIRFAVVDNGPGIPPEMQDKVFGKFQQIDSSDSRAKGGTGLGLAISKALVERHGGSIGVYSTVGRGSTFWFEIPSHDRDGGERTTN